MNQYDRDNLNFILKAAPETLKHWYETISESDRTYASDLLKQYSQELTFKSAMLDDDVSSTAESGTYLQKFKLNP